MDKKENNTKLQISDGNGNGKCLVCGQETKADTHECFGNRGSKIYCQKHLLVAYGALEQPPRKWCLCGQSAGPFGYCVDCEKDLEEAHKEEQENQGI